MDSVRIAFEGGYTNIKLYFMMGLPTETMEDVEGVYELAKAVIEEFYATPNHAKGRPGVAVSLSTFIPKPFTPFEFEPQLDEAGVKERQAHLKSINNDRKIVISWSKYDLSLIEAVLARGDRRTSKAIYAAWKRVASWTAGTSTSSSTSGRKPSRNAALTWRSTPTAAAATRR